MADEVRQRYEEIEVDALLERYTGLRIVPSGSTELVFSGTLCFRMTGPEQESIEDCYEVEMRIARGFPASIPTVHETGDRIPKDFHKLIDGSLCLGSPTEIRWKLSQAPSLVSFVEGFVIPYLYGYSFYVKHGRMPYGERAHGDKGILEAIAEMFGARSTANAEEFLWLAAMKKRDANKRLCACGSGRKLGQCHNRRVNHLRRQVGRQWFQREYVRVLALLEPGRNAERESLLKRNELRFVA